jgi:hypothetical protein
VEGRRPRGYSSTRQGGEKLSQRPSGYARKTDDRYETPAWVVEALIPHVPAGIREVWEPAAASGQMAKALSDGGFTVVATDVAAGIDFLRCTREMNFPRAIITNPPFNRSCEFIEHALKLADFVAMLLRIDYDSALTRRHIFADCEAFSLKLVLLRRIRWFADSAGSPSFNHGWYVWNRAHSGAPCIAYGPADARVAGRAAVVPLGL